MQKLDIKELGDIKLSDIPAIGSIKLDNKNMYEVQSFGTTIELTKDYNVAHSIYKNCSSKIKKLYQVAGSRKILLEETLR